MTLRIEFDNSYARLPDRFHARLAPEPVPAPVLIRLNHALAAEMGLNAAALSSPEGVAMLAGNILPEGADPIAQAYAGHQFGGFVPQLGDGRAHLLGEVLAPDGRRFDIQLKGSGRTPFSRMGDGRAWVGPVLREYLLSEAMHALGVPTTRALAAVSTGAPVYREGRMPGAILTRVAESHIRVGTFQYFAVRDDQAALQLLTRHVIARHFPQVEDATGLLRAAVEAQARLVAQWMALGFVHGVMNTDNCHVAGLTIDYGPCAFLDAYQPNTVFSSIDQSGRYAYANQPNMAVWNLAQLATCLLPQIAPDEGRAVEIATEIVHEFAPLYQAEWLARFRAKLGLVTAQDGDRELIETLLSRMASLGSDFTRSFRGLAEGTARAEFAEPEAFDAWEQQWAARLQAEGRERPEAEAAMRQINPAVIPRNHRVEEVISAAVQGDYAPFHRLCDVLARPFDPPSGSDDLRAAPTPEEVVRRTFCGT